MMVLQTMIYDNGRKFVQRFSGDCKEQVERFSQQARDNMDMMASPSLSPVKQEGSTWVRDLTWYSVD